MTDPQHVVLDASALLALGEGNRLASRFVARAAKNTGWLYVPTCALVEADRARPGLAEHIGGLKGVELVPLDLAAALWLARHDTWGFAHTVHTAMPNVDRPLGAAVATARPQLWAAEPLHILDVRHPGGLLD